MKYRWMFLILAFPAALAAQASRPSVPTNTLTPLGTMKVFQKARADGDSKTLTKVILATQPSEQRFVSVIGSSAEAEQALRKAIHAKFPKDAQQGEDAVASGLADIMNQIDQWNQQITGDTAVVGPADQPNFKVTLQRVSGEWLMQFSSVFSGADTDDVISSMDVSSKVMLGIAKDIMDGKLITMDEVNKAGQERMMQATIAQQATTRPENAGPSGGSTTQP